MRLFLAVMAFAFCALAVACDSSDGAGIDVDEPCTNDATKEALQTVNATSAGSKNRFRRSDDELTCRLRRALLKPTDAPTAWSHLEQGGSDILFSSLSHECVPVFPRLIAGVRASYLSDSEGDSNFLGHDLYAFEPGAAGAVMDALPKVLQLEWIRSRSNGNFPLTGQQRAQRTLATATSSLYCQ